MDPSAIASILQELQLNENDVANIYHHGSWVYGTNSPTSDRDLIIVTRSSQSPLHFTDSFDYFHEFELHRLWNQYDVCIYSMANFEVLLEKNFFNVVQCVFLPDEFKIKEHIDYRAIYLDKYYNQFKLKLAVFYEVARYLKMYETGRYSDQPTPSSQSLDNSPSRNDYILKSFLHGLRYSDYVKQLVETRSIHDFKRVSYLFDQLKEIRGDPSDHSNMEKVAEFFRLKSMEYKLELDALVPTNIIQGLFEAYMTFDSSRDTDHLIDQIGELCHETKYKPMFIQLGSTGRWTYDVQRQLIVCAHYDGAHPAIRKEIEAEVRQHFPDLKIRRLKIKVLGSNENVPESNMEKIHFWDDLTSYFEFRYTIEVRNKRKRGPYATLQQVCRRFPKYNLRLSHDVFQLASGRTLPYVVTLRLFDVGRKSASEVNDQATTYLTKNGYAPIKVVDEFVVYDSNIELDADWM